ncbi:MAG: CoA pyrophosphatase [Chloroflexi bacterium]|nr:CoA pyrophosphatase [Chloroflexota bacterium]MBI3930758.1 CoA pyrophosphatase [Chloroflexota bacterium]
MEAMQPRLKQALAQRQKSHIINASYVSAAILIPIYYKQGEYHILFTKRTDTVKDHKGQISFPGGAYEKKDKALLNTALRECTEEIGLAAEAVELLGELDDYPTIDSGYIISPFVGVIPWPYPLKVDPIEVEKIIEVPVSALLDKSCLRLGSDILDDRVITAYFYHYQEEVIWGATARILNKFLDIWTEVIGDTGSELDN